MKPPKPPPTPDPYETANAQQLANVEVAVANTALMNADEDTPDGFVRFAQTNDFVTTSTYDNNGNVTGTRDVYRWKKTTSLTPTSELLFDQQQTISVAMNEWALGQVGVLRDQQATPLSVGNLTPRNSIPAAASITADQVLADDLIEAIGQGDIITHHATVRDAIEARVEYNIAIAREARIVELANQGLQPGMQAYDDDLYAFSRESTDNRQQAYLAAGVELTRIIQTEALVSGFHNDVVEQKFRLENAEIDQHNNRKLLVYRALADAAVFVNEQRVQELQEETSVRGQNLNEISALMHGGQVQVPRFAQFRAGNIDRTPVAESVYQSAAMDMQKYQSKVSQQQQMLGGLLGFGGNLVGGALAISDARVKTDIITIGNWRDLSIYAWNYINGVPGVGFMAQDVRRRYPQAVRRLTSGLLVIDYRRLVYA